jgi:hypothetical protein
MLTHKTSQVSHAFANDKSAAIACVNVVLILILLLLCYVAASYYSCRLVLALMMGLPI